MDEKSKEMFNWVVNEMRKTFKELKEAKENAKLSPK